MDNFYRQLAEVLEVDAVEPSNVLRDYPQWDSLTVLSVISMIDTNYGVSLTARDLINLNTALTLHDKVLEKRGA